AALAEEGRQILQLLRAALEWNAEFGAEPLQVGATAAGYDHARGLERTRQPPRNDRLGHQRRNLDADIDHRPGEGRVQATEHLLQPRQREVSGEEGEMLAHASSRLRRRSASASSSSVSTTLTSSKLFSRAVFSRSIRRG